MDNIEKFLTNSLLPVIGNLLKATESMASQQSKEHAAVTSAIDKNTQQITEMGTIIKTLTESLETAIGSISELVTATNDICREQTLQSERIDKLAAIHTKLPELSVNLEEKLDQLRTEQEQAIHKIQESSQDNTFFSQLSEQLKQIKQVQNQQSDMIQKMSENHRSKTDSSSVLEELMKMEKRQSDQIEKIQDLFAENTARIGTLALAVSAQKEDPGIKALYEELKRNG